MDGGYQHDPICTQIPTVYTTFRNLLTSLRQCGCIFQGQWVLLLCRGWSLHRLNWTHCNYSMPLILHFFKQGLLLTLFHGCTSFKKKMPFTERHVLAFPTVMSSGHKVAVQILLWLWIIMMATMRRMRRMMITVVVAADLVIASQEQCDISWNTIVRFPAKS